VLKARRETQRLLLDNHFQDGLIISGAASKDTLSGGGFEMLHFFPINSVSCNSSTL
jgi:hypothetical protein